MFHLTDQVLNIIDATTVINVTASTLMLDRATLTISKHTNTHKQYKQLHCIGTMSTFAQQFRLIITDHANLAIRTLFQIHNNHVQSLVRRRHSLDQLGLIQFQSESRILLHIHTQSQLLSQLLRVQESIMI
jgi:hypothetical protein